MQIGLKVGNTFLVDKIENLNFNEIQRGNQFLIVEEVCDKYEFLNLKINSYITGTLKDIFYDMIYSFDKNNIDVDLSYESDYHETGYEIENTEKIIDVYTEIENDNYDYLFFNDKKYLLPHSISFNHEINSNSHPILKPFYNQFFEKGLTFPERFDICQEDKNIVNKAIGYKLNDNLAIIFNIEIKANFDEKFPLLQRDKDIYFISSDGKYNSLNANKNKFNELLSFIMDNIKNDILGYGEKFLKLLKLFNSDIISYIKGEESTFSLYSEFNSLRPYYLLSYDKFKKLFEPFFVDDENEIKCYYDINNNITYHDKKQLVIRKKEEYMSSYSLERNYKDIYRCVISVKSYNDNINSRLYSPYTGEVYGETTYEDYACKLFKDSNDSWNRHKEIGIVPLNNYWVSANDKEIKEAIDRRNTMEELKNCQ